jgi:AcrR family transcriptional regulator
MKKYGDFMDRRQRKTREAIFKAFISLLSKKHFNEVTVGEIIQLANVGRATFYAHFETKDFLLKDLCAELFDHIFSPTPQNDRGIFQCDTRDEVFLHLFTHIKQNDNNLRKLLSCKNNELFLEYFKNGVKTLVAKHISDFEKRKPAIVPKDFWEHHVTTTFIETLRWWLENKMEQSPETITQYFLQSV